MNQDTLPRPAVGSLWHFKSSKTPYRISSVSPQGLVTLVSTVTGARTSMPLAEFHERGLVLVSRTIRITAQTTGVRNGQRVYSDVTLDICAKRGYDHDFGKDGEVPQTRVFVEKFTAAGVRYEPMLVVTSSIQEVQA